MFKNFALASFLFLIITVGLLFLAPTAVLAQYLVCNPGDYDTPCTGFCGGCDANAGEALILQCNSDGTGWDPKGSECLRACEGPCVGCSYARSYNECKECPDGYSRNVDEYQNPDGNVCNYVIGPCDQPDPACITPIGTYECGGAKLCGDGINYYKTFCDRPCGSIPNTCRDTACPGPPLNCTTKPGYCETLAPHGCEPSGCGAVKCDVSSGNCYTDCTGCGDGDGEPAPSPSPPPAASPSPPPPPEKSEKACKYVLSTDQMTKVVLTPISKVLTTPPLPVDTPIIPTNVPPPSAGTATLDVGPLEIKIDFSKLAAIFSPPTSNYLEGKFQSQNHRLENIFGLSAQNLNEYHGPVQKAAPLVMLDQLRVSYVVYVHTKPAPLVEEDYQYTDIFGANPKTIDQMWLDFGGEPKPPSLGGDPVIWQATWARYWDKIPTAVNEFYYGILTFPTAAGTRDIERIQNGQCPEQRLRRVFFVMPEYFRTTSIANQINQLIVPKAAQSSTGDFVQSTLKIAKTNPKDVFAKMIETIFKPVKDISIQDLTEKIKKSSFQLLNPIKNAYALVTGSTPGGVPTDPEECPVPIPPQLNDLEGTAPFCSLQPRTPQMEAANLGPPRLGDPWYYLDSTQLRGYNFLSGTRNETCANIDSPYKLDFGTDVDCTFYQSFSKTLTIQSPGDSLGGGPVGSPTGNGIEDAIDLGWDSCVAENSGAPSPPCTPGDFYRQCGFGRGPCPTGETVTVPWQCNATGTKWDITNPSGECTDQCLFSCTLTVNVYPTFYIPWLAPIWNNTTYSDTADKIAIFGGGKTGKDGQVTGRPGFFGFFTPKATEPTIFPKGKNLPSEEESGGPEIRQRFFGAAKCLGINWTKNIPLKPNALQDFLSIIIGCPAT
ncbi:hypothetical protein HYU92_01605 [Candidatus Curtissbacteria bacterium]|nr:hypothetical protein [Candidatus Curtissbacteria bacterium]